MVIFTICARNFLAQALVLQESIARHHPEAIFHVALGDSTDDLDIDAFRFQLITLEEIGIPRLSQMLAQYDVTQLNTAIKPFVFALLFDRYPGAAVTYFDPDILVVSPLEELENALEDGANCVLTPHLCEPAEHAELHEGRMLQYGIYNLGFCALRDAPDVRRVVGWWGRRLERFCIIDMPEGLFFDQKWADLLPAFIERTRILRHPGYNVAFWNLSQRTVRYTGQGWEVNGQPLRFFHFSGSQLGDPPVFSRHSTYFTTRRLGDLGTLFREYIEAAHRRGFAHYATYPYGLRSDG